MGYRVAPVCRGWCAGNQPEVQPYAFPGSRAWFGHPHKHRTVNSGSLAKSFHAFPVIDKHGPNRLQGRSDGIGGVHARPQWWKDFADDRPNHPQRDHWNAAVAAASEPHRFGGF